MIRAWLVVGVGALLLPLSLLMAAAGPTTAPDEPNPVREQVVIGGETFRLELAVTEKTRVRGFGGRTKLDDDGGMLFVFRHARHRTFWMKDCLIDIDAMFLDDRGRITAVHKLKKQPPRADNESVAAYEHRLMHYPSRRPCRFVIELKPGSIDRLKIKPGQTIKLDLPGLKKKAR